MQAHRASYWKTTLTSLGTFVLATILAIYWIVRGEIRVPALGRSLTRSAFSYWPLVAVLVLLSVCGLLLGVAGFVCLYGDSGETKSGRKSIVTSSRTAE